MGFGAIGGATPDNLTIDKDLSGQLRIKPGNAAGQGVILDGAGKLPAVDGSALTSLPHHGGYVRIALGHYNSIVAGDWTLGALPDLEQINNSVTPATGDKLRFYVDIPTGTYTIKVQAMRGTDAAILGVDVAGVNKANVDLYGTYVASMTFTVTGISLTAGVQTLDLYVNSKNASSSNFLLYLQGVTLYRTA